jgi:hypothetical protein
MNAFLVLLQFQIGSKNPSAWNAPVVGGLPLKEREKLIGKISLSCQYVNSKRTSFFSNGYRGSAVQRISEYIS